MLEYKLNIAGVIVCLDRLVLMEKELAQERISEQKKLAREEVKLNREFEKEHRILQKVMQDYQVM